MSTRTLKLTKKASGYYTTSWREKGTRHFKSFGKDRAIAQTRFSRFHSQWLDDANVRAGRSSEALTVRDCWTRYENHARTYYRHLDGSETGEADNLCLAMREVLSLFGGARVSDFDLLSLERCRDAMVASDLSINTINARCHRIRRVFRWCAKMKYVSPQQVAELNLLDPLKAGRTKARATDPVTPVPEAYVRMVQKQVPPTVEAMIEIQLASGMRSGELVIMRPIDVDTSKRTWIYRPSRHKGSHVGRNRVIPLGPKARRALKPFLKRDVTAFCFSPKDAMQQRWSSCETHRSKPSDRTEDRWLSDRYTSKTYARVIARACETYDIEHWSPNRLRHSCLTNIRDEFGLESSQSVGGHSRIETTQIYAATNLERAINAMERAG